MPGRIIRGLVALYSLDAKNKTFVRNYDLITQLPQLQWTHSLLLISL